MHGFRIGSIVALVLAALTLARGASADVPTTGERINLIVCVAAPCESTYPAGQPFFVRHGFGSDGSEQDADALLDPKTRFELTVDGKTVPQILDLDLVSDLPSQRYVSNFRFGLTGVHTFVGCWYAEGTLVFCGTRTITFTG